MEKSKYVLLPVFAGPATLIISNLLGQMELTRNALLDYITGLDNRRLDIRPYPSCNSIGALLKHIAAVECWYSCITFEGRELNEKEKEKWYGALFNELDLQLISGNDIGYYLRLLNEVRQHTIDQLKAKDDTWLMSATRYRYDVAVNNYYCLYHVLEHENVHFGQIRMLIRLMKHT